MKYKKVALFPVITNETYGTANGSSIWRDVPDGYSARRSWRGPYTDTRSRLPGRNCRDKKTCVECLIFFTNVKTHNYYTSNTYNWKIKRFILKSIRIVQRSCAMNNMQSNRGTSSSHESIFRLSRSPF